MTLNVKLRINLYGVTGNQLQSQLPSISLSNRSPREIPGNKNLPCGGHESIELGARSHL